jgi:hypothetical protein
MADYSSPGTEHERKRKRLTNACTRCRSRKVRCDDRQPSCTNCVRAGVPCVTFDPRQPNQTAERREAQGGAPTEPGNRLARTTSSTSSAAPQQGYIDGGPHTHASTESHGPPPTVDMDHMSPVGLLPTLPRFITGSSLYLLTQWLDLAFARRGSPQRFSTHYKRNRGNPPTVPFSAASSDNTTASSGGSYWRQRWSTTVGIILPLFESASALDPALSAEISEPSGTAQPDIIQLLTDNILAASMPLPDEKSSIEFTSAVNAIFSNLGSAVLDRREEMVELLILSVIVLREAEQMDLAWRINGLAVSVAQTIGLHQRASLTPQASLPHAARRRARIWWSLYVVDKMLCVELERASAIRDLECNQEVVDLQEDGARGDASFSPYRAAIELAKIQARICDRLIQSRADEEAAGPDLERVIVDKMRNAGELDGMLVQWAENLPSEHRPSEMLYCDTELLPAISHLALQYYQTLFLLHRHSLILNTSTVHAEVARHFSREPYRHRLRNGHIICSSATRSIVNILTHVRESRAMSVLNTSHAPLLASYGLAIQIVRHPNASGAKSDLELQATAIAITKEHLARQQERGTADEVSTGTMQLLDTLHGLVRSHVSRSTANSPRPEMASLATPVKQEAYAVPQGVLTVEKERVISPPQSPDEMNAAASAQSYRSMWPSNAEAGAPQSAELAPSWPPDMDLDFDSYGMQMDWDALVLAFDLPR